MGKFNHHAGSIQTPKHVLSMAESGVPEHTKPAPYGKDMADEGMLGAHSHDRLTMHNAHPHMEHSVGYDGDSNYTNHGIDAIHIRHGKRDKGSEHHPPQEMM